MSSPTWRKMFNTWEKAVAPGLEGMTASSGFQDLLAVATRVNATMAQETEKLSRQWLHAWNLPAATDVRRLRQQVAGLERELKATRRQLATDGTDAEVHDMADLGLVATDDSELVDSELIDSELIDSELINSELVDAS